ncbi:MAG: SO_0444 family Cu/Zn efflux transporter [Candidatus Magnetomorum sp.]|nr:SO_0444 family Cu/Zn efflux transporter [Candidatus Magnetomorum sp.]
MNIFMEIAVLSWGVVEASAVYMLFGFFIAGLLHAFLKQEHVYHFLGKGKIKSVILSSLIGVPLPLCSCSVVPAAAGIKKQGANQGATLAFLISTPETGMDSISITYALIDPLMTIIRPISALCTGIVAGLTENFWPQKKNSLKLEPVSQMPSCSQCCQKNDISLEKDEQPPKLSIVQRLITGLKYAYIELPRDIGKWFIIGIILSGLILYFVPENFIDVYVGNRYIEMLVMMFAGIPMYVCATASTPIAAALIAKGMDPGAALVFLLVGPATNIASLTMIAGLLGKRSLIIYLSAIIVCSFAFGWLTSEIYPLLSMQPVAYASHASHSGSLFLKMAASIVLLFLFGYTMITSWLSSD